MRQLACVYRPYALLGIVLLAFCASEPAVAQFVTANPVAVAPVNFNWANVGDVGNSADPRIMTDGTTGYGSVPYMYAISKSDVTNAQYVAFLNAVDPTGSNLLGLYTANMSHSNGGVAFTGGIDLTSNSVTGSKYTAKVGEENQPVVYVSWNAAARFINWLTNGQGSGSTESGTYDMQQAVPVRSANAVYALPTENEWYKAAYYNPNLNGTGGYNVYATQSDTPPSSQSPGSSGAGANYYGTGYATTGAPLLDPNQDYLTDVGAYYNSASYYGTYDQAGDVYQWTESLHDKDVSTFGYKRVTRGSSYESTLVNLSSSSRGSYDPSQVSNYVGFRVVLVPEPTSLVGIAFGVVLPTRSKTRQAPGLPPTAISGVAITLISVSESTHTRR